MVMERDHEGDATVCVLTVETGNSNSIGFTSKFVLIGVLFVLSREYHISI